MADGHYSHTLQSSPSTQRLDPTEFCETSSYVGFFEASRLDLPLVLSLLYRELDLTVDPEVSIVPFECRQYHLNAVRCVPNPSPTSEMRGTLLKIDLFLVIMSRVVSAAVLGTDLQGYS